MINELKMAELKDLFFYTFGIVPLDNYNVVGDGMTDNRLQIQQAIYDALEVGTKYIFVTKGNYYYSCTLKRAGEVIFIGNSVDTNIEGIEIRQFPDLWKESRGKSGMLIPIGGIILCMISGEHIPDNYLECNGQTVNVADYEDLYRTTLSVIGTDDDYPETFTIPNIPTGLTDERLKYIVRAK